MKKKAGIILLVFLVVLAGLGWWQRNNLSALMLFLQTDQAGLEDQMEQNRQNLSDAAHEATGIPIRGLTEEEKAALKDGTLSREDLILDLIGGLEETEASPEDAVPETPGTEMPEMPEVADPAPAEPVNPEPVKPEPVKPEPPKPVKPEPVKPEPPKPVKPEPVKPEPPKPVKPEPVKPEPPKPVKPEPVKPEPPKPVKPELSEAQLRKLLAACIADLLVLQEEYTTWLADANEAAIAEFVALPPAKQTAARKYNIGNKYMALAGKKEKECDRRVAAVEDRMLEILNQLGDSHQLLKDVHATYLNEKATKKAYYLSLHT